MKITEVRIFPKEGADKRLRAFATLTFDDCFVIRDIKIIEGSRGYFVAMPSRRLKEACSKCGHGNAVRSNFCNQCGVKLDLPPISEKIEQQGEHKDVAHPITSEYRDYIQKVVLEAYQKEKEKISTPQVQQQGK